MSLSFDQDRALFSIVMVPAFYRLTQYLSDIHIPADYSACLVKAERVIGQTKLPVVLEAILAPSWQGRPLHRAFGGFPISATPMIGIFRIDQYPFRRDHVPYGKRGFRVALVRALGESWFERPFGSNPKRLNRLLGTSHHSIRMIWKPAVLSGLEPRIPGVRSPDLDQSGMIWN
jgi:hypothetical protein